MANAILAYGNLVDSATLSGGSWLSTLPLTNLQDRRLGKVARSASTDTSDTQFDIDLGQSRLVRVVGLVGHNFTLTAQYRIRLSNAADFGTTVADSGWSDVWPVVYPLGSVPWGSLSFWSGRYSAEEIAGYTGTLVFILPTSTTARYARVEIDDQDNPADYVHAGRGFIADAWQPLQNMEHGSSLGWEDLSETQRALSGAIYSNERPKYRVVRPVFEGLGEDEAMAVVFDIQRRMGTTKELLFIWDPDDTVHALRRQFLGHFRALSSIENPGPDRWRTPFEIEELI